MEGSSWCSKLRQESMSNTAMNNRSTKQLCDHKLKGSSWDFRNEHNSNRNWKDDGDLVAPGFSWPPRSYTCSFCKREFRSAQALGGHMNVHRRDRARLRLSSSTRENNTNNNKNNNSNSNGHNIIMGAGSKSSVSSGQFSMVNLNLDPPNPSSYSNPSFSTTDNLPSISTKSTQITSVLPPVCHLPANAVSGMKRVVEDTDGLFGAGKLGSSRVGNRCEVLKKGEKFVRLELEIGVISQSNKEDLDLELRLGYI